MRRITSSRMSVDIRNPQQQQQHHHPPPRTPRKVRINPPSPSLAKSTPRKQPTANGAHASSGSPESTRNPSAFANGGPNLASAKEASRRMNSASVADSFVSPRKLPDDRFNSIVKQLNHASSKGNDHAHNHSNGLRSNDELSVVAGSEGGKSAPRKPRKLSVSHHQNHSEGLGNGVNGHKG